MLGLRIGAVISSENFPDDFPARAAEELKTASPRQAAVINYELAIYYYSIIEDNDRAIFYLGFVLEYFRLDDSPWIPGEIDINTVIFILTQRWGRNLTSVFGVLMDRPACDISDLEQGIIHNLSQAAVIRKFMCKFSNSVHPGAGADFECVYQALRRAFRLFG